MKTYDIPRISIFHFVNQSLLLGYNPIQVCNSYFTSNRKAIYTFQLILHHHKNWSSAEIDELLEKKETRGTKNDDGKEPDTLLSNAKLPTLQYTLAVFKNVVFLFHNDETILLPLNIEMLSVLSAAMSENPTFSLLYGRQKSEFQNWWMRKLIYS